MAGGPKGTYKLSQWEIDELLYYRRGGVDHLRAGIPLLHH